MKLLIIIVVVMSSLAEEGGGKVKEEGGKVVVVGGGLAGMCAAVEAVLAGVEVVLIEKQPSLGGNSMKATSGMNAAFTSLQQAAHLQDDWHDLMKDTVKSGGGLSDEELARVLASNSNNAFNFLLKLGIQLNGLVRLGGHSRTRTHRFNATEDGRAVPVGFTIVSGLKKWLHNKITVMLNTSFVGLITQHNNNLNDNNNKAEDCGRRVVGVRYVGSDGEKGSVKGVVVLTAGGFGHDRPSANNDNNNKDNNNTNKYNNSKDTNENYSLLCRHAPSICHLPTTNGAWATGDVLKAIINNNNHNNNVNNHNNKDMEIGMVDLDKVQVHPTAFVHPQQPSSPSLFLAPESLRGFGALLLNHQAERFVDELSRRDEVTGAMMEHCRRLSPSHHPTCFLILNKDVVAGFGGGAMGFYVMKGLVQHFVSSAQQTALLQAALFIGAPASALKKTLQQYAQQQQQQQDWIGDELWVAMVTPAIHYTMGGLRINQHANALCSLPHRPHHHHNDDGDDDDGDDDDGEKRRESFGSIEGLYAAGEVTGGVHGRNRLGGNSLLECVVYGRLAGANAANHALNPPYADGGDGGDGGDGDGDGDDIHTEL